MKKIYILLLFAAFLIKAQAQNSQGNGTQLISIAPVAPTAASLGKFGTIQPDICTGIPKIEIPIYQIKCGDITVPISLSYSSGGIKVEELASWVGLGWALNCGGVITHTVRGMEDTGTNGYQTSQPDIAKFRAGSMTPSQMVNFKYALMQMTEDGEPDLYTFNFGGNSGTFSFSNSGTFITSPRKHWKIEQIDGGISVIFKITTENGFQYLFTAQEQTTAVTSGFNQSHDPFAVTSAWYLTQIMDTKGNKVTFTYTPVDYSFNSLGAETEFVPKLGTGAQTYNRYTSQNNIGGEQLSSITFNSGTVQFIPLPPPPLPAPARQDAGEPPLQAIKVTNNNGVVVKNFVFYTSYFGPTTPGMDKSNYRLRLDAVREESTTTTDHLNPYTFTYNDSSVNTLSISQDYWGYYNAKPNTVFVRYQNPDGTWAGADRSIDHTQDQIYILKQITYPTGGYTQFTYEGNDYTTKEDSTTTVIGPGIRVKKIANFIGSKEEDKYYTYNTFGQTYSSGTIADLPGFSYDYTTMSASVPPNTDYTVFSSGSNYPLINFNGSYVVYANVTETRDVGGTTGKTEYTYTNFKTNNDDIDYSFPFVPNRSYSFERGLITNKKDYKWTGSAYNPVHEDLYEYVTTDESFATDKSSFGIKLSTNTFYNYDTTPDIRVTGTTIETYFINSDIFYQRKQKSRDYDPTGSSYTEKDMGYGIDNITLQTNAIFENLSNGKTHTTTITYPENYTVSGSSPETVAINQMISTHITNPPIEKVTWQKSSATATDSTVVSAQLQKFLISSVSNSTDITSVPLLNLDYPLANSAPLTDFSPYTGTPTSVDGRYNLLDAISYNAQGNSSTVTHRSYANTGYQWGYANQYPVAEVKNATNAQFFQQNFEDATGSAITTTGGHTGHNYYNTSYAVTWAVPADSRNYVLSYWYLSGGVWTYSGEIAYTGPVTLTAGSGYDDIRIYPVDANITTFTYEPLLGVTSITDTKGEVAYYEYDEFQRLMNVKDKDGNITKNLIYHYFNNN